MFPCSRRPNGEDIRELSQSLVSLVLIRLENIAHYLIYDKEWNVIALDILPHNLNLVAALSVEGYYH
jgi:hypothetical protein